MKAVVFDFDGTLTEKKGNLWKRIWKELGHRVDEDSYYMSLLNKFMNGNLTHKDWCIATLEAFKEKGFTKQKLYEIIKGMSLIQGAEDLIKHLYSQGIELHIVSGNIISVIEKVLGENKQYISNIKANEFVFDENGYITEIVGTKYDHEGKATFILELCERKGYKPSEVLFIGNSINDEWVYKSGARTLCVNPDETKIDNKTIWNKVIYTDNLLDLEKEI